MTDMLVGISTLVVVFILVLVLALQMQISKMSGKLDEILKKVTKP